MKTLSIIALIAATASPTLASVDNAAPSERGVYAAFDIGDRQERETAAFDIGDRKEFER